MNSKKNFVWIVAVTVCAGVVVSAIIAAFSDPKRIIYVVVAVALVLLGLMRRREFVTGNGKTTPNKVKKPKVLEKKNVKPEQFKVACRSIDDVIDVLKKALPKHKLKTMERVSSNVYLFHRRKYIIGEGYNCFMAVDLRDEVRYPDRLYFKEILPHMLNLDASAPPLHAIRVVLIICVDERDKWLDAFVDGNLRHEHNYFRLPVIISFSNGEMIMAKQKRSVDDYGGPAYKKMRNKWLEIAEEGGLLTLPDEPAHK